jgi:adenylate kinase family enzyme
MANGTVMRGDEIVPIIASHISSLCAASPSNPTVILLDGFPRNANQEELACTGLASARDANEGLFPDFALYFSCRKELLKQRYLERRRAGLDNEALFEKRWAQHETEIPAVLQRYRERGILLEVGASPYFLNSRSNLTASRSIRAVLLRSPSRSCARPSTRPNCEFPLNVKHQAKP